MALTYTVSIDQEEIQAAVTNHVKQLLGIEGDVEITLTNGSGRAITNLGGVVVIAPPSKVEPLQTYTAPIKVIEQAPVVEEAPAIVEPVSEVEQVMAQPEVTVGGILDFGSNA